MDLLDLFVKIGVKDEASKEVEGISSKLKNGLVTAGKVAATGIATATAAVGALAGASLGAYASYEQLVGGVETLFKTSADTVKAYADAAYQSAGMSANAYMETVTSFSAALLQGLGGDTAAAAEVANQAIVDMSDNANKMGTDIAAIQYAYQGFAKQNYTMLDNLKLGYGGTQAEMARLINDSGVLGDTIEVTADTVNQVSFDKIIEAIHVVQTEMGITGTTAKEAATTIEGSVSAAKGAWTNLITGIADDNADLDVLIDNFVSSAETAAENIIPRVEQILGGLGSAIEKLAPIVAEEGPTLVVQVLPSMVDAGTKLLLGLVDGVITAAPALAATAPQIIGSFISAGEQLLPMALQYGYNLLLQLSEGAANGIPELLSKVPVLIEQLFTALNDNFPAIIEKGTEILVNLASGIGRGIPKLVPLAAELVYQLATFLANNLPLIIGAGTDIILSLIGGILQEAPNLLAQMPVIIMNVVGAIASGFPLLVSSGVQMISSIKDGLFSALSWLISNAASIGRNIVDGVWSGIQGAAYTFTRNVKNFFSGIVNSVKNLLGIRSPSRVFAGIGGYMAEGLEVGWSDEYDGVKKTIQNGLDFDNPDFDPKFPRSGGGRSGGIGGSSISYGTVNFTINAKDGQSAKEIAKEVAVLLEIERERAENAFA